VSLIERSQGTITKPLALIKGFGLYPVIVNSNLLVGVADADVKSKVVAEHGVVGTVVELG
jgi:hypothetical protein